MAREIVAEKGVIRAKQLQSRIDGFHTDRGPLIGGTKTILLPLGEEDC